METGLSGCGMKDPQELFEEWFKILEPWLEKYRNGELKDIPQKIIDGEMKRLNPDCHPQDIAWGYDRFHPAVQAWIWYETERTTGGMSISQFLKFFAI